MLIIVSSHVHAHHTAAHCMCASTYVDRYVLQDHSHVYESETGHILLALPLRMNFYLAQFGVTCPPFNLDIAEVP